jgi:GNAT superfamily N-acetyltransferase
VIIRAAREEDTRGFAELAGQVEHWFGSMAAEPGFHAAVARHIDRRTALVATRDTGADLLGGLLFTARPATYHVRWLVVAENARGTGVGRALLDEALRRFVTSPGTVEVVTFGADHPGAAASGARIFYERLGFAPAEAAAPGPEGGSRQVYRKLVNGPAQSWAPVHDEEPLRYKAGPR